MSRIFCTQVIGLGLILLSGCGSGLKLSSVRGKVLVDGQPYPDAKVVSYPQEGVIASGKTNQAGEFELSTSGEAGALQGRHTITVSPDVNESVPTPGQPIVMLEVPYDAKFRDRRQSTLTYEVSDATVLTIDLTGGTVSAE